MLANMGLLKLMTWHGMGRVNWVWRAIDVALKSEQSMPMYSSPPDLMEVQRYFVYCIQAWEISIEAKHKSIIP